MSHCFTDVGCTPITLFTPNLRIVLFKSGKRDKTIFCFIPKCNCYFKFCWNHVPAIHSEIHYFIAIFKGIYGNYLHFSSSINRDCVRCIIGNFRADTYRFQPTLYCNFDKYRNCGYQSGAKFLTNTPSGYDGRRMVIPDKFFLLLHSSNILG